MNGFVKSIQVAVAVVVVTARARKAFATPKNTRGAGDVLHEGWLMNGNLSKQIPPPPAKKIVY